MREQLPARATTTGTGGAPDDNARARHAAAHDRTRRDHNGPAPDARPDSSATGRSAADCARVADTTPNTASAPTTIAPARPPVTRPTGVGSARQVVTVAAGGDATGTATVSAYERDATGWKQVFGPWTSYIGRNGVAPPGGKREGDGRTPSGVYGFDFMFGVNPDPGVHYPYRHITGPNIVWDDDPASPGYNEWIDRSTGSAGASPEPMDTTPSYLYGVVIAYNDARTPGLGSGIFLHVSHGSPTTGCISLPSDQLRELLRWLRPARQPRIAISG